MNEENIFVLFLGDCRPAEFGVIKFEKVTKVQKKSMGRNCHRGDKEGSSKKGQKTHSPQEPNKKGE